MGKEIIYICDRCGREEKGGRVLESRPDSWVVIHVRWDRSYILCPQCWQELGLFEKHP